MSIYFPWSSQSNATTWSVTAARRLLQGSSMAWFAMALCGQWLFACYIALLYLWPVFTGDYLAGL